MPRVEIDIKKNGKTAKGFVQSLNGKIKVEVE